RVQLTALANAVAKLTTVGAGNRLFTGRIDFHQQQYVGLGKHLYEIVVKITGAAETMGLVDHHQASISPAVTNGLDHRCDFSRVMAVIVDQHHAAALDGQLAVDLEAPSD